MRPKAFTNYLSGYPEELVGKISTLIDSNKIAPILQQKYPQAHDLRSDKALYEYTVDMKNSYLRNAGQLNRVVYDTRL